jgi:hypothetical protein
VGVLCRKPGATGSLVAKPRPLRAGETRGRVCARQAYYFRSPGKLFVGTVFRDQRVAVQRRSASGRWVRIATDVGGRGWLSADALC